MGSDRVSGRQDARRTAVSAGRGEPGDRGSASPASVPRTHHLLRLGAGRPRLFTAKLAAALESACPRAAAIHAGTLGLALELARRSAYRMPRTRRSAQRVHHEPVIVSQVRLNTWT